MNANLLIFINSANLVLGAVAFIILFRRTFMRRREYPTEVHLLFLVLEGIVIALLATSAELLTLGPQVGNLRMLLISILIAGVKTGLLVVLWKTRHALYRTGTRSVRNDDEKRVDRDLEDHPNPYLNGVTD